MVSRLRTWVCSGLILGLSAGASARTIRIEASFQQPQIRISPVAPGDYASSGATNGIALEMPGCTALGDPGDPFLPMCGRVVLLAPDEEVTALRVYTSGDHQLPGRLRIMPAPTPQAIGARGPFPPTPPNAGVYDSDQGFPPQRAEHITTQCAWGHRLAFLRLCPVTYHPRSGRAVWHAHLRIEIETETRPDAPAAGVVNLRRTEDILRYLAGMVVNPEDLGLYEDEAAAAPLGSRLDPDYVPYVVVTTAALEESFQQVVHFQSSRGLRARTVLIHEILAAYPGVDDAEQLRNFVIDAYQMWQTRFVLLGGDYPLIPIRRLYGLIQGFEGRFPGECYYEGLDGTWNDDGDDEWGEWGEWDLVGEVAVGRAPVESADEFERWWHKTVMYTEHPVVSEIEKGLFLGEQLDEITWGGDYMDEVKDYAATHGYETSGYPETYLKQTLYDLRFEWDEWDLIPLINAGFPTTHHLGHSAWDYVMKLDSDDIVYLTNDGVAHSYMLNYSQGCHSNMFHYSGSDDAIAEKLVYDEHGSAAFVGNTSYGYFFPGVTSGPSQHYERQFVDACYAEDIVTIGWMNVDSKVDNIWQLTEWLQWCHYELCVTGDPALPQWRRMEGALALDHAGTYVIGQSSYEVTVTAAGSPVDNAIVTLYSSGLEVWSSAPTNASGLAAVPLEVATPMTLYAKAVKPDHLPGTDSLIVAPASGPWLRLAEVAFDDDGAPPSSGDGDGQADAGETLELLLTLENIGPAPAESAALTLRSQDARFTVLDSAAAYGPLAPGGSGSNLDALLVQVTPLAGDQEIAYLQVEMACAGRPTWQGSFGLNLHAPVLSLVSWELDDTATGDGEGDMDPGETFALRVSLSNTGSDEARQLTGVLSSESPDVEIENSEGTCALIPPGGQGLFTPDFAATLGPLTPTDIEIAFDVAVTTWAGQSTSLSFEIPVASFYEDDFESDQNWSAGVPGDNATAGVWVRVDPIGTWGSGIPVQPEDDHSPLGTHCFVTGQGQPGGPAMASDVDGGRTTLLSPMLDLTNTTQPRLIYWRWWTNNYGPFTGEDPWRVEVSDDGGQSWLFLENTWDGRNEWVRQEFYLPDYIDLTDQVRIRFVARDETHDSLIEAAIDDLSIESLPGSSAANEGPRVGRELGCGIQRLSPTTVVLPGGSAPITPLRVTFRLPSAGRATLQIIGIDGAVVATLLDTRLPEGLHQAFWNGDTNQGVPAHAGVYWCRLTADRSASARKMLLVR
jgi:hypothetical protein